MQKHLNSRTRSFTILLSLLMLLGAGLAGRCATAPVNVLFLLGQGLKLDAEVAKTLTAQGIVYQTVNDTEPLTAAYLRQFHTVVLGEIDSFDGGGYYAPGGSLLANTEENIRLVHQYVADGGGVVVVPLIGGDEGAATYATLLAPWKIRVLCETIRDEKHPLKAGSVFSWTRNISRHPVTDGVKALAYPTQVMRWDDQYPSSPLLPADRAWKVLARGEQSSRGLRSLIDNAWGAGEGGTAPVLAAARDMGPGRVVVTALSSIYLLTHAFAKESQVGEFFTGSPAGIAFQAGDGKQRSDWGQLLLNAVRWTATAGERAGFGNGTPAAWKSPLPFQTWEMLPDSPVPDFAVIDWKNSPALPAWAIHGARPVGWHGHYFFDDIADPRVTKPQQMNRVLIGARSVYSDGAGTVAEWAAAAKMAGYRVLVFTERFERLDPAKWEQFMTDCQANSSDDLVCLQGLDIADTYGNRFLIMGNTNFPNPSILTPDRKTLRETQRLSMGFARNLTSFHRPGTSALSFDLARHFQAISVYTYAQDGAKYTLVDNGFPAYQWQLKSASNPVPVVVHELTDPKDVAQKGTLGFQLIVPSQDAHDAARYFRAGLGHFFESPQRYFITEGPLIDDWGVTNRDIGLPELNRDHFRVQVGASSSEPGVTIHDVTLYDRDSVARHWTPNTAHFAETADGEQGYQRYYMLVVTDSKGRRAISPHLRTVGQGYFTRCADRQNFFGAALQYTGIWPGSHAMSFVQLSMPVPGSGEVMRPYGGALPGENMATRLQFPFASNSLTFTDLVIDERYRLTQQYGMDAWQLHNTMPSRTYEAWARVSKWNDVKTGITGLDNLLTELTGVEVTLRARQPVQPTAALYPVVQTVQPGCAYLYRQGDKLVTGKLDGNTETILDLPAGTSLGNLLLLTPQAVSGHGEIGWRADTSQLLPMWTEWRARYEYIPLEWRASLGAEGPTPWSLALTQGKQESALGVVNLSADRCGVTGTLQAGGVVKILPVRVTGLNANWPAACWTPGKHLFCHVAGGSAVPRKMSAVPAIPGMQPRATFLNHIGVYEGIGYASLDNSENTTFFIGNTLTASNSALILAYTQWTKDTAGIEAHNPTNKPITARLTSPAAITDYYPVNVTVTVPPGSTVRVNVP